MIEPLTPNTQAILLLTAPLLAGRGQPVSELLSPGEYNRLARILRERQKQPADLIGPDSATLVAVCAQLVAKNRLESLLGRGFLLSQAVEQWRSRAIWVFSRADAHYPKRLKARLKEDAPPVLFGCGDVSLLEQGGLAVVGSRQVDASLVDFTEQVGRLSAKASRVVVSGGARGVDRAAMNGALAAGGRVAGVMADSLERAALARENREALMDGRLVLVSPYDPAAGFNVGHAMQRNKLIYALADAALVVSSDFQKGGTWAGAIEQLNKLHFVPVFVRQGADAGKGNPALMQRGAIPWPEPTSVEELERAIVDASRHKDSGPKQASLSLVLNEEAGSYGQERQRSAADVNLPREALRADPGTAAPDLELWSAVSRILCRELVEPRQEGEIAALLGVSKTQARAWLKRLLAETLIEQVPKSRPVRYRSATAGEDLL